MIDRHRHIRYLCAAASDFLKGNISLQETVHTLESVLDVLGDPELTQEFEDDVFELEKVNAKIHDGGYDFERFGRHAVETAATRIIAAAQTHLQQLVLATCTERSCTGKDCEEEGGDETR